MIFADKLFKLFEQSMNDAEIDPATGKKVGGNKLYRQRIREAFGIVEGYMGDARIDHSKRVIDPREISIGDLAAEFLPRRWSPQDLGRTMQAMQGLRLVEAEGFVVLPSHFSAISAFNDIGCKYHIARG